MLPLLRCSCVRLGYRTPLTDALVCLVLALLFTGSLGGSSAAQNVKGQVVIGNGSGATPSSSQMLVDATQFQTTGGDMCSAITAACGQLGATGYPLGATIDARGFTGNQVCKAINITTMLFSCVSTTASPKPTGGKLLLGNVNLYADGPASGNYTDNLGSGVGTPALIIPNNFWGIEGISRGANPVGTTSHPPAGPGTFLSVCTGSGTPIDSTNRATGSPSCTTGFPQRTFPITNISVTSGTPTTMVVKVSGTLTSGSNVYLNELAMVRGIGTTGILPYNGSYRIQHINASGSNTVTFTVPPTFPTTGCSGSCGTLIFGTPVLGFGPGGGNSYNTTSCASPGCASFGLHIKNLGFNCQGTYSTGSGTGNIDGCIGWQNLYAQEESGADTFLILNYNFLGFDNHGNNAQNFGPITNGEILTGGTNSDCDFGTTGAYIDGITMRGFDHWTINTPVETGMTSSTTCGNTPRAALMLDAENTETSQGHCENFSDCVLVGANSTTASGIHVTGISEAKPATNGNDVEISANNSTSTTDFEIENVQTYFSSSAPTVKDDINNITLTNPYLTLYSWSKNSTTGNANLVTTDGSIPNQFQSGVSVDNLLFNATAPTVQSPGFNTGSVTKNNGPAAFTIAPGTGPANSTGTVNLPTAANGWACFASSRNTTTAIRESGTSTTSASFTATANWSSGDTIQVHCFAY